MPDQLSADQIRAKLAQGDFVELADVPDLVWKKVPGRVPGGRDVTTNTGPEHPNHYADIDRPGADGRTLRDICLADKSQVSVAAWQAFYDGINETDARSRGLLPLRVWQFFDAIVAALQAGDIARAVCGMGVVSHYIGDACQPLHGSMLSTAIATGRRRVRRAGPAEACTRPSRRHCRKIGVETFSGAERHGPWWARLFCPGYRPAPALLPTGSNLD